MTDKSDLEKDLEMAEELAKQLETWGDTPWHEGNAALLHRLLAEIRRKEVPEGYVLVPIEPTQKMIDAYMDALANPVDPRTKPYHNYKLHKRWKAMIFAATGKEN